MAVTEEKLRRWARNKNLRRLHNALRLYDHEMRLTATIYLGLLKDPKSLPHLERLKDDTFEEVIRHAAHAIQGISPNHPALAAMEQAADKLMTIRQNREISIAENYQEGKLFKEKSSGPSLYLSPADYEGIEDYADLLENRDKLDRIKSWTLAILCTIGLVVIAYIIYVKTQDLEFDDFFRGF